MVSGSGRPPLRAIIMADGKGERWGNFGGGPKHLLRIDGETLIHRAVRLLRQNGVTDIILSARNANYEVRGATRWAPPDNELETDKFYATRSKWSRGGETLLLWGDCYFSDHAIEVMCRRSAASESGGFLLFGRAGPSAYTGKRWGELFGLRIADADHVLKACTYVRESLARGEIARGGGWELYRHLLGRHPNSEHFVDRNFCEIDDFTDDFDFPEDFTSFMEHWSKAARRPSWPDRARSAAPAWAKRGFRNSLRWSGKATDTIRLALLRGGDWAQASRRILASSRPRAARLAFALWRRLPLAPDQKMRLKSLILRTVPRLVYSSPLYRESAVPTAVLQQVSSQWLLEPALVAMGANALGRARVVPSNYLSASSGLDLGRMVSAISEARDWVVIVPHLVIGGADKYVADFVRQLSGNTAVQIWVTDQARSAASEFFNNSISTGITPDSVVFLPEILGSEAGSPIILARLLNSARPQNVGVFNSNVALKSIAISGRALSRRTRFFCWFFSVGVHGLGAPYANRYARRLAEWSRLATDNDNARATIESWIGGTARVSVIPPEIRLVDDDLFNRRIAPRLARAQTTQRKRWLWVSRIERMKGTEILGMLVASMPEVDFDIFGTLQQPLVEFLPRSRNGRYRGVLKNVPGADLSMYDGFVFTSLFEGMPNVVLEMSQHGLPLVLADVGGLRETFTDSSAFFVQQHDDSSIAAARFADAIRVAGNTSATAMQSSVEEARARVATRHGATAYSNAVAALVGAE